MRCTLWLRMCRKVSFLSGLPFLRKLLTELARHQELRGTVAVLGLKCGFQPGFYLQPRN